MDKNTVFIQAEEVLSHYGIPGILPQLREAGVYVRRHLLNGGHSNLNYPPLNLLPKVADATQTAWFAQFGAETRIYVHIGFCRRKCPFCHYSVVIDRGKRRSPEESAFIARYIEAVKRELRFYAEKFAKSGTRVNQIYIGGGTGLILSTEELRDLTRTIYGSFAVLKDAGFTVEGSPEVIVAPDGKEKLLAMRELGANRVTFGVQSFNDFVLKAAARGHKRELAFKAAETARSVFENWGFDLMQGLSRGSNNTVWDDLQSVAELRPAHLCWYLTRLPDSELRRLEGQLEPEEELLFGRMLIFRGLAEIGYRVASFVRSYRGVWEDTFAKRHPFSTLGIGPSAYSKTVGVPEEIFFRNIWDVRRYVDAVEQGQIPIEAKQLMTDEEQLAASYVIGLRRTRTEHHRFREIRERNPALSDHYRKLEDRLIGLGVLERYTNDGLEKLRLSGLGRLFEDDVLQLFHSPAMQKLQKQPALSI